MKPSPRRTLCISASATVPFFVPPGVEVAEVAPEMVLPGSNIVVGPYAGHAQIRVVEFVKSSARHPEGRSARIRRRGSVERREVEPHQRPREEEGGRHDFQETRENPVD
ncbi:GTP-binding protein [Acorus gramineus]|uniref:GTP-binding protein n=1 Tax=Acorus gramineus TaxID=55184 RepID=A0AAV9B3L8_ACOGR|nr:GTP-binding protein [Acorus gramineus]